MTMTEPSFPVQAISGVPVVITPEEIDITNAGRLRAALLRAAARPGAILVVDMTRTWFCDSAGLHALLGAHKRAQAEGRQVRLAVTGPQIRRILALTALDRLLPVYTSLDQALAHPPADSPRSQPKNRPDSKPLDRMTRRPRRVQQFVDGDVEDPVGVIADIGQEAAARDADAVRRATPLARELARVRGPASAADG